jgi:aldose 1-epimerase
MKKVIVTIFLFVTLFLISCEQTKTISKERWGTEDNSIYLFTLKNEQGATMQVTNLGAAIVSLTMPDRDGEYADIVLGYDNPEDYQTGTCYLGAIVGRYGNRIAGGKFSIGETEYQLPVNSGKNHLHGGFKGFDKVIWTANPKTTEKGVALELNYKSKDGEENYPGNFDLTVVYTLTDNNELFIEYTGTTDQTTIVNPTHHSYFNLTGNFESILEHELMINADHYTPVDENLIPTGEIAPVEKTAFDFRQPKTIGRDIQNKEKQLQYGLGYDHNWVLNKSSEKPELAATVYEKTSGRFMEVFTTEPGLQFYSGNFLNDEVVGKDGVTYGFRHGLCLETQHYPDSPNHPDFPSTLLKPGETYTQKTIYKFSTK